MKMKEHGEYKGIFAYKVISIQNFTVWGYLFWDRHPFMVVHHNTACYCEKCRKDTTRQS